MALDNFQSLKTDRLKIIQPHRPICNEKSHHILIVTIGCWWLELSRNHGFAHSFLTGLLEKWWVNLWKCRKGCLNGKFKYMYKVDVGRTSAQSWSGDQSDQFEPKKEKERNYSVCVLQATGKWDQSRKCASNTTLISAKRRITMFSVEATGINTVAW